MTTRTESTYGRTHPRLFAAPKLLKAAIVTWKHSGDYELPSGKGTVTCVQTSIKNVRFLAKTVTWNSSCGRLFPTVLGAGLHFPAAAEGGHGCESFSSQRRDTLSQKLYEPVCGTTLSSSCCYRDHGSTFQENASLSPIPEPRRMVSLLTWCGHGTWAQDRPSCGILWWG